MSILRRDEDVANEEDVYFNFINSIKSDATKKVYRENINSFMKFCNVTKLSDLLKITEPQKQIINYLMSLRKRGLAFNSISIMLNAIYHFYEMNDIPLNKKKINLNLVRHGQNHKQKFAPFTRSQRRKRRIEVYKLHFEHGVPAIRIAELMKVDRNTINNDLKILYREALNDYNPEDISLDDILQKQLLRLETQRDRLCLYLSDAKDIDSKIAIERLIADIDFKLIGAIEKVRDNVGRFWDEIIKKVNKIAEDNKMDIRYTSLFELHKISIDSRKSLNKLREDVLREKKS